MDGPSIRSTDERVYYGEMMQALQAHQAELLRATTTLAQETNPVKVRGNIINWMAKQIGEEELTITEIMGELQLRAFDIYEGSSDRRYGAGKFLRLLTLGARGHGDADRAGAGAAAEVRRLLETVEELNQHRLLTALVIRIRLLEQLLGTDEDGTGLAMDVLQAFLPEHVYRRILALAVGRERGGQGNGGPERGIPS